jgi:hypothetical protein
VEVGVTITGTPLASFIAKANQSDTLQAAGLKTLDQFIPSEPSVADVRRRRLRRQRDDQVAYLSLLQDEDGLLRWEADQGPSASPGGRRAGRRGLTTLSLVEQYKFEPVHGSQVAAFLEGLDASFNALRGLHQWTGARLAQTEVAAAPAGRILLLVHGTFSKGDALFEGLASTAEGSALVATAQAHYNQVLSFEHPTLAVSPILNALDLARAFATTQADVDVVCHSRGGLVARWWLEVLNTNPHLKPRVVFVGSPLQGTSLASPIRLRTALNLMTNVIAGLQAAGHLVSLAVPLFGVIAGLMKLLASVTGTLSRTPIADVALGMIPGLAAQSRRGLVGGQRLLGNFELDRLSAMLTAVPAEYFVVKANFEPTDPGWAFWRYFMRASERLSDLGADLVFPGENDLVVDTASMDALSDTLRVSGPQCVLDFGTGGKVHHLNYFSQPQTATFLQDCLKL